MEQSMLNESNCNQEQMMERRPDEELLKAVHDHQPPIRGNDPDLFLAIEY